MQPGRFRLIRRSGPQWHMHTYRDRISILTWVTGVFLALQPVLIAPTRAYTWYPFGTPLTVVVGRDLIVAALLALVVVAGTQWVLAAWDVPRGPVRWPVGAWALPLAISLLALRLLPHQLGRRAWVAFLVGTLLALALTWHALARDVGGVPADFPVRFVLRALAFVTAGMFYLWVYVMGERALLAVTQMSAGSFLLATEILRQEHQSARARWLYGGVTGIVVGELAWAFRHTALSPLRAGLTLLLAFYLLTALSERALQATLTPRIVLEYLGTSAVTLVLILLLIP